MLEILSRKFILNVVIASVRRRTFSKILLLFASFLLTGLKINLRKFPVRHGGNQQD